MTKKVTTVELLIVDPFRGRFTDNYHRVFPWPDSEHHGHHLYEWSQKDFMIWFRMLRMLYHPSDQEDILVGLYAGGDLSKSGMSVHEWLHDKYKESGMSVTRKVNLLKRHGYTPVLVSCGCCGMEVPNGKKRQAAKKLGVQVMLRHEWEELGGIRFP